MTSSISAAPGSALPRRGFLARRHRSYYLFVAPALVVIGAVIIFPWLFTVWMSAFDWKIGTVAHFVGLDNYAGLATNQRFLESIVHTFYFTALAVNTNTRYLPRERACCADNVIEPVMKFFPLREADVKVLELF